MPSTQNKAKALDAVAAPQKPGSSRFQRQRERMLDAATPLLNERGVRGMTFEEVAQALSLTTTSVLYYFPRKEQLAEAIFEESLNRLEAMVDDAGRQASPKARVARYLELHFEHHAEALRGRVRPLAILSEMRALEDATRESLFSHYKHIFRGVRSFFGPIGDEARKNILTGRTQMLNEVLFWLQLWLSRYAISDFGGVRRRMFAILEHGIAAPGMRWNPVSLNLNDPDLQESGPAAFLRVATRLINDTGYRGTSIDRIVAELNLSKGSFYHHLDAKDDLVLECFRDSYRRMLRMQRDLEERGESHWQQLVSGIASSLSVQFGSDYPLLRSTALQAMPAPVREKAHALLERTALRFSGLLVEGMAKGTVRPIDPMIASQMVMSTIHAAYDIRKWAQRQDHTQAIANYASPLMTGIFDR